MEALRLYDFNVGAETSTQPDAGTPVEDSDLITLGYLEANYLRAPTITGTWASPEDIVAGDGIEFVGDNIFNTWFIQGSGGAVDVSANPQIAAGSVVGQRLALICVSDTNTVTLEHGTGLTMNGPITMKAGSRIEFEWGGATPGWIEQARNGIEAA